MGFICQDVSSLRLFNFYFGLPSESKFGLYPKFAIHVAKFTSNKDDGELLYSATTEVMNRCRFLALMWLHYTDIYDTSPMTSRTITTF